MCYFKILYRHLQKTQGGYQVGVTHFIKYFHLLFTNPLLESLAYRGEGV